MSEISDEGEDYDNVIGYLGYVEKNLLQQRSRSIRGSYADLQQLKHKDSASENQNGSSSLSRSVSFAQAQYAPVYQKRPTPHRSSDSSTMIETSNTEPTSPLSSTHESARKKDIAVGSSGC